MSKETITARQCIIKGQNYDELISVELAQTLKDCTNGKDRKEASLLSGVSTSYIDSVLYRSAPLNEKTAQGIKALIKSAIINRANDIRKNEKAIRELTPLVK